MKRAASVAAAIVGLGVLIVALALFSLFVSGKFIPRTAPQPTPAQHEVVVTVTGAPGTEFRVQGEVFGDTGPIALPESGHDTAHFTTSKAAEQLDLVVHVSAPLGDDRAGCTVSHDGRVVAQPEPVPLEGTHTLACRVRSA